MGESLLRGLCPSLSVESILGIFLALGVLGAGVDREELETLLPSGFSSSSGTSKQSLETAFKATAADLVGLVGSIFLWSSHRRFWPVPNSTCNCLEMNSYFLIINLLTHLHYRKSQKWGPMED